MLKKKKSKKRAKKQAVPEVSQKLYRVEIEMLLSKGKVRYYTFVTDIDEVIAERQVLKFKAAGVGGRLYLLDGSPNGELQQVWGGVDRVADAAAIEKMALEKA